MAAIRIDNRGFATRRSLSTPPPDGAAGAGNVVSVREGGQMQAITATRPSYDSPLRYPGGKSSLAGFLAQTIESLDMSEVTYVEPFAGGAGAAISLLLRDQVQRIVINDLDPAVYAFWWAITEAAEEFIARVREVPLTIDEWRSQRAVYAAGKSETRSTLDLGFAFFFLNRTNRSGVLNAGVIGGQKQAGRYKIDARFPREALIARLQAIHTLRDRITVSSEDGRAVVERHAQDSNAFIYVDPPYVQMGGSLYLNSFSEADHTLLAMCLNRNAGAHWLLTYDDVQLTRELYKDRYCTTFELNYSAQNKGKASELVVFSDSVRDALGVQLAD